MRASGILLPIASLPGKYGIGTFSRHAYEFVNQLEKAGQKYWQILPLGPTGYGDSPYQSFSTYAGNPYYIDLEELIEKGWLTEEECNACDFGDNIRYINYEKIYQSRFEILRKAYERSNISSDQGFQTFVRENEFWLKDYGLYMAVKNHFKGKSWNEWDNDICKRSFQAMYEYSSNFEKEIEFYQFLQYEFLSQWTKLKRYANERNIQIIGDIPIYVAFDSADSWANPELFQFDENGLPIAVAGCPPDGFSATGQLWGNPLYKWDYHKKTGYEWWINRIAHCFKLYDVVRVDHFRGFDEYYSIPYGDETAEHGHWEPGPGIDIFRTLEERLGKLNIIAEDLGFLTPSVLQLVKDTGYPGMKVIEFAFDSREESDYLPHNYDKNCIVYTGTHDNQTLKAWYDEMNDHDRDFAKRYMNLDRIEEKDICWEFIRMAISSVAKLAVIPIQDYLELDQSARINTPSTLGDNWHWRLEEGEIYDELLEKIREMSHLYGRI